MAGVVEGLHGSTRVVVVLKARSGLIATTTLVELGDGLATHLIATTSLVETKLVDHQASARAIRSMTTAGCSMISFASHRTNR